MRNFFTIQETSKVQSHLGQLAQQVSINLLPCELHPRLWQTLLSTVKVGSWPPQIALQSCLLHPVPECRPQHDWKKMPLRKWLALTCPSAVISHTPPTLLHCLNSTLPASSATQRPDTSCKLPALVNPNTSWPSPATMASTQAFALKPAGVDTTHCSWIAVEGVGGSNCSYC